MKSLEARITALEQYNAALCRRVHLQTVGMLVGSAILLALYAIPIDSTSRVDSITVREISIVDEHGTVRARLGGNLPDAGVYGGRVVKSGRKAAGLIIYDEAGIERGAYVTQVPGSHAMLTLDSKYQQAVLLATDPGEKQSSTLQLWTKDSAIELRSDSDGSRVTASTSNQVGWQMPEVSSFSAESCNELRDLATKYPGQNFCRTRFTEPACRECLTR